MKKIFYLIATVLFINCWRDDGIMIDLSHATIKHFYENKSEKDIKIITYLDEYKDTIYIKKDSSISQIVNYYIMGGPAENEYRGVIQKADSIVVFYNNERYKKWKDKDTSNRNPLGPHTNYIELDTKNRKAYSEYKYIFTPEDYLNAEPCNGNCE